MHEPSPRPVSRRFALLGLIAAPTALSACATTRQLSPIAAVQDAVASPERPPEDRKRDVMDRPAEVLQFFGVRPGLRVFDLNAAGGYYTELLARVVGPSGHVIAQNDPGAVKMMGADTLAQRYRQSRLPNVTPLFARESELSLPPASLDMVLMSKVYHDTYWYEPGVDWGPVDQQALLRIFHEALRPGGVVGVIDHVAEAGSDPRVSAKAYHRIDPQIVRGDFQRAGFALDGESDLLRNAEDDHRKSVFDPAITGRTDRFVMRFRRK
jgi:predicted methyltransferase